MIRYIILIIVIAVIVAFIAYAAYKLWKTDQDALIFPESKPVDQDFDADSN